MKKLGFTLIEIMIVVSILAIASVAGASSWRYALVKSEFDGAVNEIISVFQTARSYSSKSVEIEGDYYNIYRVKWNNAEQNLYLQGYDGAYTNLETHNSADIVDVDAGNFWVNYEVPYSYATTNSGDDIQFTVTSLKGSMSKDIIIHNISGIAETVE